MPSFHAVTTWIRRNGASGALDNVTEVLAAREASHLQVETLAAHVGRADAVVTPLAAPFAA